MSHKSPGKTTFQQNTENYCCYCRKIISVASKTSYHITKSARQGCLFRQLLNNDPKVNICRQLDNLVNNYGVFFHTFQNHATHAVDIKPTKMTIGFLDINDAFSSIC